MSTLVIFFSRKGYVKREALRESEKSGADVLELRAAERTQGILGFWWCGRFGMHRWGMPIESVSIDLTKYDTIVLAFPIWVFTVCAPMREFARQASGKVKSVRYIMVHFSFPMNYARVRLWLDKTLGVVSEGYESVCCVWGRVLSRKKYGWRK